MKLRFRAKCGENGHPPPVVNWPGAKNVGQLYQYVGRRFDLESRVHRAVADPVEVDSETRNGKRLAKLCRRDGSLWPADAETAKFCGVPFVELSQDSNGEWVPKTTSHSRKTESKVKEHSIDG